MSDALRQGIELAAKWVEQRLNDYDSEHGNTDPETGTREYPGRGAGEEYVYELHEIIEGIRALAAQSEQSAAPVATDLDDCTPADARVLRHANIGLATESHELQMTLLDLWKQVKKFCEEQGEADFETYRASALLKRLGLVNINLPDPPASLPPAPESAAKDAPPVAGWQLVPKQPTAAMIDAVDKRKDNLWSTWSVWQVMLAAAPVDAAMWEATP